MILCNPIIHYHTFKYTKQYYKMRLLTKEFWHRLIMLRINLSEVFFDLFEFLKNMLLFLKIYFLEGTLNNKQQFLELILNSIIKCDIPIKFILSANDVVAKEFQIALHSKKSIRRLLQKENIAEHIIKGADHTFSKDDSKKELFKLTLRAIDEIAR